MYFISNPMWPTNSTQRKIMQNRISFNFPLLQIGTEIWTEIYTQDSNFQHMSTLRKCSNSTIRNSLAAVILCKIVYDLLVLKLEPSELQTHNRM